MIKGLAITPPAVGRISIGRVVEKNGKRLPEKDDQFTLTTQVQNREGWILHPMDEALRQSAPGSKLRSIPVRMLFDDPSLNLRAEYSLFDRSSGRPLCVGNGETCQRLGVDGVEVLSCPSPSLCPFAGAGSGTPQCKPYGRLHVQVDGPEAVGFGADVLDTFVFRTTGFNSIRTLAARLFVQSLALARRLMRAPTRSQPALPWEVLPSREPVEDPDDILGLVAPVGHEVVAEAAFDGGVQRGPPTACVGLRAQDHSAAFARHLHLLNIEAKLLRQADSLRVAGLKDFSDMGHGDLLYIR